MALLKNRSEERQRELRRRVMVLARLRNGGEWSDACILNISSRGLMIRSGRTAPEGSIVELHRGDHLITARVVWRDGPRAGLQTEERLPGDEILSEGQSAHLQLIASDGALVERRKFRRPERGDSRMVGRMFEFAGLVAIVAGLASCLYALAQHALGTPIASAAQALDSRS